MRGFFFEEGRAGQGRAGQKRAEKGSAEEGRVEEKRDTLVADVEVREGERDLSGGVCWGGWGGGVCISRRVILDGG